MEIYKTDLAKKFFVEVILRDGDFVNNDQIVYLDPRQLSYNEYWLRVLFPEKYGYGTDDRDIVFTYFSSIESLPTINKMFDIIHGLNVQTSIEEDFKIAKLLYNYAGEDVLDRFLQENGIKREFLFDDTHDMDIPTLARNYIDIAFWDALKIEYPFYRYSNDIEDIFTVYQGCDIDYNPWFHIYISNTNIMNFLNENVIIKYLLSSIDYSFCWGYDLISEGKISKLKDIDRKNNKIFVTLDNFMNEILNIHGNKNDPTTLAKDILNERGLFHWNNYLNTNSQV